MERKLKLLYCINSLAMGGGTARVLSTKASYFADVLGYEVHILVGTQRDKPLCYEFSPRVKIHIMEKDLKINVPTIPFITFKIFLKNAHRVYERKIKEINPDFVTVLGPYFEDFIVPNICKTNHIVSIRELHFAKNALIELGKLYDKWIDRIKYNVRMKSTNKQFNNYDAIVLLTERDRKDSDYSTRVEVIPNVLELGVLDIAKQGTKQVAGMGSFRSKAKRFDIQVRIWKEFIKTHPDWVLNIYGDGIERENIQKLIDELKLNESVILHGNINDVTTKLLNADFFISTSHAEGMPMVFLEAMECGLPIISFDCPCGPSDIIIDGYNGFLVDVDDSKTMLDKIRYLADNPDKSKQMGENAKESTKRYSLELIANKWKSFYESFSPRK